MRANTWRAPVVEWIERRGASAWSDEFLEFFERAFQAPLRLYPNDAWFGVHAQCVSLTIGNMWLAAIASPPKCVYVLAEPNLRVKGLGNLPIPSTLKYAPLDLLTAKPWSRLGLVNADRRIWDSYARACETILESPVSRNVIKRNLYRKARLSEFLGAAARFDGGEFYGNETPVKR